MLFEASLDCALLWEVPGSADSTDAFSTSSALETLKRFDVYNKAWTQCEHPLANVYHEIALMGDVAMSKTTRGSR